MERVATIPWRMRRTAAEKIKRIHAADPAEDPLEAKIFWQGDEPMKKRSVFLWSAVICGMLLAFDGEAQVNERTFRFAHVGAATDPSVMGAGKWNELLKEKSGGKLTISVFGNGVLGDDLQALAAVQSGTVDMTAVNSGILQGQAKEFAVFDIPFTFENSEEASLILDGSFGQKLAALLPTKNLYNLAYWEQGFRQITNSKRAITRLDDFVDLKFRVTQVPLIVDAFAMLGADFVQMSFNDLYEALNEGVVDGQESPLSVIESSRFNEVQKYLTITNHAYGLQSVLINKQKWDSLTNDERELMTSTLVEATRWQRENSRKLSEESLANLKKTMTVMALLPEELVKFRERLKPVVERFSVDVGLDLFRNFQMKLEQERAGGK
jgi:tripartite ATP-independent transporter DctP family solute receptor